MYNPPSHIHCESEKNWTLFHLSITLVLQVILVLAVGQGGLVFLALMEILDFQVLLDLQVKLDLLELLDRLDNLAFQEKRDFRDLPALQVGFTSCVS